MLARLTHSRRAPVLPQFFVVLSVLQVGSDGSSWVPGFFDRNSYQEYLSGWGKSIVVGRARIGGIPMGVINVETRLSEQVKERRLLVVTILCGGCGWCWLRACAPGHAWPGRRKLEQ